MSGFNIQRIILGLQPPEWFLEKFKKPLEQNKTTFLPEGNNSNVPNRPNQTPTETGKPNVMPELNRPVDINKPNPMPEMNRTVDINKPNPMPEMNRPVDINKPNPMPEMNRPVDINKPNPMPEMNRPVDINKPNPMPEMNRPVDINKPNPMPELNRPVDINKPNVMPQIQKPEVNKPHYAPEVNLQHSNTKPQQNQLSQALQNMDKITQNLQSNLIANADRSVLIKSILGLPPKLSDVLLSTQNSTKPLGGGTLGLGNINPSLLQQKNVLASLFDDTVPLQAAVLQNPALAINMPVQTTAPQQDAVALFFSGMVSLPDISKLIIQNSKQAVAGLIIAMASTSKQGMSKEQIQETLNIINSCVAMAESNNPAQTLKSLMLLYLPWLPLNDGVGFDLEITPDSTEDDLNNSKLTVLIQTKNFGNLKGVFTLTTTNSVDIMIICTDTFPKNLLYRNMMEESTSHAMNTNIDIEQVSPKNDELNDVHETKVNLSATNEMNPYLLLMAHSFIRHTILIDNQQSLDLT